MIKPISAEAMAEAHRKNPVHKDITVILGFDWGVWQCTLSLN